MKYTSFDLKNSFIYVYSYISKYIYKPEVIDFMRFLNSLLVTLTPGKEKK